MVLESLFPAKKIVSKPLDMVLLAFIISIASIYIAHVIFPAYGGVVAPLLITVGMTPVIYRIFSIEESIERKEAEKKIHETFLERHGETIELFALFFIGNFLAILLVAVFAPETFVQSMFAPQLSDIYAIRGMVGAFAIPTLVSSIIMNNLKIMVFSFLLSFVFGTGAIFILSWNASILAIYLASFIREGLYAKFAAASLGILPHAPIEVLAYFLAGIAGGMLSVGVIRERFLSKEFLLVFEDALIMLLLSVFAVAAGAMLEVWL